VHALRHQLRDSDPAIDLQRLLPPEDCARLQAVRFKIYLYCVLLPFGLVDAIGAMTPVVVAFVAYTFFALEALGAEIEEPFGTAPNDLALDAMSQTIEASLREMTGEPPSKAGAPDGYIQT
jgi:putative membrane protein